MTERRALVLLSGGQDSTVCLASALERYDLVETIGFDYGQRHRIELEARPRIRAALQASFPTWGARLGPDHLLVAPTIGSIGTSAMTAEIAIETSSAGLPNTFVPGRNLVFLTYAAAVGYRRGIDTLIGGMCETDYSGYPDCRNDTLQALARAISLGMDKPFTIETPLMYLDKAETWALAADLGGEALVRLIIEETHTCYLGNDVDRHDWGYGCGSCPACVLRCRGWERWRADLDEGRLDVTTPVSGSCSRPP